MPQLLLSLVHISRQVKFSRYYILLIGIIGLSCSPENNSWVGKRYHNLTSHYNGYYYSREEIAKIEKTIAGAHRDDYNDILSIFPSFDSTMAKGYEKEIEESIKMASLVIQNHPNSKWTDDAYILVGKARLYSLDWGNAIQTFKYVNTKSEDKNAKHESIINLIRTFTVHKEYNNAQAAIDYLLKQELSQQNKKNYYLEKAYYHQQREELDNMVRSLSNASPLLKKADRRGRIYFIIGQVYQQLGFDAEAFNFYKKCLSTNPDYETDFYARLYMAQVAEISRSRDINAARKSFRKLLRDRKNKEFKDKIYLELAGFELKQDNIEPAILNYNLAISEGNNKRIDGESYLQLGVIHYERLKDYEVSQAYYDSAVTALPPDFEGYEEIRERHAVLNEFVKNLNTISWQDSLLRLSPLDSTSLRHMVDSAVAAKQALELAKQGKKKKKRERITIEENQGSFFEGDGINASDWYFGNPSAVANGQIEFRRIWGEIPLMDNWRRQQDLGGNSLPTQEEIEEGEVSDPTQGNELKQEDPALAAFLKLQKEIPRTAEQKEESLKKIEEAYFRLGDIYYFDLQEKDNALASFKSLLNRFPKSEHKPEVYYKLYLINNESNPEEAQHYAQLLRSEFPESTFAKILDNPNYLAESSITAQKQKAIYSDAYERYNAGEYVGATQLISTAMAMGETTFTPNLLLLQALITGKTTDIASYQESLQMIITNYPKSEVVSFAEKLLKTAKEKGQTTATNEQVRFTPPSEGPHYFVMVYEQSQKLDEVAAGALGEFNRRFFSQHNLTTSSLALNETLALTIVDKLPTKKDAMKFYSQFIQNVGSITPLQGKSYDIFLVTNENFNTLYRTKSIDEYLRFFKSNYLEAGP